MDEKNRPAALTDKFATVFICFLVALTVLLLGWFVIYILYKGAVAFTPSLLSFSGEGIGAQLFNTIYIVFLSLLVSVPVGVAAGIYMAEYMKSARLSYYMKICIETLSSLPSIVVGLFGYLVFIVMTHSRWNILAGALTLSILNFSLITTMTEDAFRGVPAKLKEGSFGLGATHWQTITNVLLPYASPRIITGIILAAGRSFGEAAALLYTAGMGTDINFSNWNVTTPTSPLNLLRPGETLALHIWALRTESLSANAARAADLSAAVLLILVLVFTLGSRVIGSTLEKKMLGK